MQMQAEAEKAKKQKQEELSSIFRAEGTEKKED